MQRWTYYRPWICKLARCSSHKGVYIDLTKYKTLLLTKFNFAFFVSYYLILFNRAIDRMTAVRVSRNWGMRSKDVNRMDLKFLTGSYRAKNTNTIVECLVAGSIAGSTAVLIGESGFSQMPSHLSVTIGGTQCSITSSSVASIACVTGPVVTGDQNYSVTVSISVNGLPVSSSIQYGYLWNLTPLVSSVSPNSGLMGGMTFQITGSKFDSNSSNVSGAHRHKF